MIRDHLFTTTTTVDEETAEPLQHGPPGLRFITVEPPPTDSLPATLERFVRGIKETSTRWLGLQNTSPVYALEIVRPDPNTLRLQYGVPTKRLERKVRLNLTERLPETTFTDTSGGLPVFPEDSVGGGHLEPIRRDTYPIRTDHTRPPLNHIVGTLHRHAMQDTRFLIQILFRPIAGRPIHRWWRRKTTFRQMNYLRKEKESLWGSHGPTSKERARADAIENKMGETQFRAAIRVLIVGAGERTPARMKEIAGAFNAFEHPETGQGFTFSIAKSLREHRIQAFVEAMHRRDLAAYTLPFRLSTPEIAGVAALPDREQQNLVRATP